MKLSSRSFYSRAMLPATFLVALGLTSVMAQTPRVTGFAAPASIIIDHKCTDVTRIPEQYINAAQANFKVAYGHTSHGSQLVSGMHALWARNPKLFTYSHIDGTPTIDLRDSTPGGDLGNPDRRTWAERTRTYLQGAGKDRNLIMWSWCGQVSSATEEDINTYLALMNELERDFPKVRFVYMTGHLDGGGRNGNLNIRNEQIRKFCRQNGKVLFDFADIESFDPDGKTNYMELNARDTCDYRSGHTRGNWADDWIAANPDHKYALPESAAHTRPLNGALKGNAFWWMMARLAGWSGQ